MSLRRVLQAACRCQQSLLDNSLFRMSPQSRWKPPFFVHDTSHSLPSISFVVAEPQQIRSVTAAADKLPNILRRAMPPDQGPSQSNSTPAPVQNPGFSSTADDAPELPSESLNVMDVSDQSASVHQGPGSTAPSAPAQDLVITTSDVGSSSPPFNQSATPGAVSQDLVSTHSLSDKRSWFNMFYWSANEETSIAEVKGEVGSASQVPDAVRLCTAGRSDSATSPAALETVGSAESTSPFVNSSLGADVHSVFNGAVSQIPHSASNKVDTLSEQLDSRSPPNPLPSHSPVSQTRAGASPPATASNTPTGMFALSFPMLAKSRSPPEIPVVLSPQDPPAAPPNKSPVAMPDPGDALNAASVNITEPGRTTSAEHVSERCDQTLSQSTAVADVRTNTWWTYLRWNPSLSTAQADPLVRNRTEGTYTSSAVPEQPPASDSTASPQPCPPSALPAPTQPEGEMKGRAGLNSDAAPTCSLPEDGDPPLVHDADAGRATQSHTWYAPWSWYQSASPATITVSPHMNSGSQPDPTQQSQTGSNVEDRVAGDRVAHPTPEQTLPSAQDPSASRTVDYRNPIQTVISANPTGWMSFFTAKAIAMKSLTYEKEGGKMEVMEIDDDIAPGPSFVLSTPTAIQASPTSVTKTPFRGQPHTAENHPPSSPPPRKSSDKRPPVPRAATKSETVVNDGLKRQPSPSPSKKSGVRTPVSPPPPNLVLPTWNDTFHALPRSAAPYDPPSVLSKTLQYVSGVLFSRDQAPSSKGKGKAKETVYSPYDKALPRMWDVLGKGDAMDVLRGCKRVVVIGVHGWFPGTVLRTFAGEPTGTSSKLVSGIVDALDSFQEEHKVKLEKVTKIPLEGEGTINRRVERLYQNLIGNKEWLDDLHDADAIFVATHSQGSVVSTHLLDRLIADRHIRTTLDVDASIPASGVASGSVSAVQPAQRICCLALCGIHLGPLRYLSTSSLVQPYIQYFESTAARELFEFQNTESALSRDYVRALRNVLNNGIKMVYIASLNDQVVGLYSGLFTSVSHPLILRALYVDGDAYHPSDFLSHLLVLLLRIRNAGLSDGGLLAHLSEVTAGSLNGIGHSTPYEERATYSLAINYLFLTDSGSSAQVEFVEEPFNASAELNDYEIPWALRDLIADDRVIHLFSDEIVALRDTFRDWYPKTSILRDVKRKLQPIQRVSSALMVSHGSRL